MRTNLTNGREWRFAILCVWTVLMWSGVVGDARAASVTATKSCMAGSPCMVTEARFKLNSTQTVNWEALYTGTPTEGHRFYVSTVASNLADIELTSSPGQLSGTKTLAAGTYHISIRTALMGPGSYSVSGPGVIGDPHITTMNGRHYDFQGVGEFVTARHPNGFELQVRMAPVATLTQPPVDPHSGLASCVSLNEGVAVRVGRRRVTYLPNISGRPDPTGLQLRVDGQLVVLGRDGRDLDNGGRLSRTAAPGGLQIDFPDGSSVTVTPNWWASQSRWYLDIGIFPPQDSLGLAGAIRPDDWLPLLPDGSSLGPRPAALHDRYVDLYQKFADAWRVKGADSLFDYAPGTSTKTYTLRSWPPEQPPCELPFTVPVEGASRDIAERACSKVLAATAHRNCVFDVTATGNLQFGKSYEVDQGVSGTKVKESKPKKYESRSNKD